MTKTDTSPEERPYLRRQSTAMTLALKKSMVNVISLMTPPPSNTCPHTGIPVRPVKGESFFIRNPKSDNISLEGCDAEKPHPLVDAADEAEEPTAEWYHAAFSTMTAMVGVSVLGLPKAFAYLTWPGGCIALTLGLLASVYSGFRLAELHLPAAGEIFEKTTSAINSPEQLEMRRNTYLAIGEVTLGKRWGRWPVILFQQILLAGISCAYLLVAGLNIESIYASACTNGGCPVISRVVWTAIVALIEMLLSFFPTGKVVRLLSKLGIACSFLSCLTAISLNVWIIADGTSVAKHATDPYGLNGEPLSNVMGVFLGLSAVAFTFGAKAFQPELQASLKSEPCPVRGMKKAIIVSYIYAYCVFLLCAATGYAAFGDAVDGNVLTSIRNAATSPAQRGLATFAQVLTTLQVIMAFQIVAMPVSEALRTGIVVKYAKFFERARPSAITAPVWAEVVIVSIRCVYVLLTMTVAMVVPSFDIIMGLLGSICTVPVDFCLPLAMYMKEYGRAESVGASVINWCIIVATVTIGILGIAGTIYGALQQYHVV